MNERDDINAMGAGMLPNSENPAPDLERQGSAFKIGETTEQDRRERRSPPVTLTMQRPWFPVVADEPVCLTPNRCALGHHRDCPRHALFPSPTRRPQYMAPAKPRLRLHVRQPDATTPYQRTNWCVSVWESDGGAAGKFKRTHWMYSSAEAIKAYQTGATWRGV